MGSEKLGANLFRITQAEAKLRRENIQSKEEANKAHFEVGYTVRKAIESLGGTMPKTSLLLIKASSRLSMKGKIS